MNRKLIVLSVFGVLIFFALVCVVAFFVGTQFSSGSAAYGPAASASAYGQGNNPGYGPGMMGGRGPMMGGSGAPFVPDGYVPPSGGVGGLAAVTKDGKTIAPPTNASKLPDNTAAQKIGNLDVTLALTPYPPASFKNGSFDIILTDDKGQAVTDAKISLDLTMPGMWMPASKPDAQYLSDGKYHASAFWTMRGLWRIEVIIARGNEKQSAFFDVWL